MESFVNTNAGASITKDNTFGQIVTATRDFNELYAVILCERPAIVWESKGDGDYFSFLDSYSKAAPETQRLIKDLHTMEYRNDDPRKAQIDEGVGYLAKQFTEYSGKDIRRLMALSTTKHHCLQHRPNQGETRALFLFTTNIQHSCRPNVAYSLKNGVLEFRAVRRIRKGEALSCIPRGMCDAMTVERRSLCLLTKHFWCECDKCMEPDSSRLAFCEPCHSFKPSRAITKAPKHGKMHDSYDWVCPRGHRNDTYTKLEETLANRVEEVMSGFMTANATKVLWQIRKEASTQLSPVHCIATRTWLKLAIVYRHRSAQAFHDSLTKEQLRQRAVISELCAVSLIECSNSRCSGCPPGTSSHQIVPDMTENVVRACRDLLDFPTSMIPPIATIMIPKYMRAMKNLRDANMVPPYMVDMRRNEGGVSFASYMAAMSPSGANMSDENNLDDDDIEQISTDIADAGRQQQCDVCLSTAETLLSCSRCKLASYCGKECQIKAWKQGHKQECISIP